MTSPFSTPKRTAPSLLAAVLFAVSALAAIGGLTALMLAYPPKIGTTGVAPSSLNQNQTAFSRPKENQM